jgi:threonine dehydrogenase-like Zn-dependent dehydrogenase
MAFPEVLDLNEHDDVAEEIGEMTEGRGTDSVIDAVGMEAHGSPGAGLAQQMTTFMPDSVAERMMEKAGSDRLSAFYLAIDAVRRGGTISLIGVYGGMADPLPMLTLFDKQVKLTMGQANVKRWVEDIMPFLTLRSPPLRRAPPRCFLARSAGRRTGPCCPSDGLPGPCIHARQTPPC